MKTDDKRRALLKSPFTREIFDSQGCHVPNCTYDHSVLYIHPDCHSHSKVTVEYHKVDGTLTIRCGQCCAMVVRIQVAV